MPADRTTDPIRLLVEAAAYLRTPEATLYYWRHKGTGPRSMKVGRRVVYRQSDLDAWLDEQATAAA